MNSLFQIATRTLGLGLLVALSLVLVVTTKGIHPEVLVAFQPRSADVQFAQAPVTPPDPLQFAQVEPTTRLDAPARVTSATGPGYRRTPTPPQRTTRPLKPTGDERESEKELPQLPPLPQAPRDASLEDVSDAAVAEVLESPAEMVSPEDVEVALSEPVGPESTATAKSGIVANPPPANSLPSSVPDKQSTIAAVSESAPGESQKPETSGVASRLDALQEQLQKVALEQEQQRLLQQSFLGSAQLLQDQRVQGKLDNIEAALRELSTKTDRPAKSEPYIQRIHPKEQATGSRSAPVVREERPGSDGEKRFSIESHQGGLRELLDTLTQKANLNLVLTINVEGDVEMSLQNATAEEALKAIENTTGYVVEKAGQKVYVRPGVPQRHQRDTYLPPIVKEPQRMPKNR